MLRTVFDDWMNSLYRVQDTSGCIQLTLARSWKEFQYTQHEMYIIYFDRRNPYPSNVFHLKNSPDYCTHWLIVCELMKRANMCTKTLEKRVSQGSQTCGYNCYQRQKMIEFSWYQSDCSALQSHRSGCKIKARSKWVQSTKKSESIHFERKILCDKQSDMNLVISVDGLNTKYFLSMTELAFPSWWSRFYPKCEV